MLELANSLKRKGLLEREDLYKAFLAADRKGFVPKEHRDYAYNDIPLPIGEGQTISQPQVVAFMLELLDPQRKDVILDIGFGSGWTVAILAGIVTEGKVIGIERDSSVYEFGVGNLKRGGFLKKEKVELFLGDGKEGKKDKGPFDKVLVSAAAANFDFIYQLEDQIKEGGKVVVPVRSSIYLLVKQEKGFEKREYPGFSFVPLI